MTRVNAAIGRYQARVLRGLAKVREQRLVQRIWSGDHTVWSSSPTEITNRLGWLDAPEEMRARIAEFQAFVEEIRTAGITRVVLLGMGGSSLAPEVFSRVLRPPGPGLQLSVVDTTDASTVAECWSDLDPRNTLFVVSSKSGGTVETVALFRLFHERMTEALGSAAGAHFIAVTDPGSGLATLAAEHGFRRIFEGDPNIGGRYSALSPFGLVPAALLGVDSVRLLDSALAMALACRDQEVSTQEAYSGTWLGVLMGAMAYAGRDKLTLVLPPALVPFGDWIEQLVAESTGKQGKGILPVLREPLRGPEWYGRDRLFIHMHSASDLTHRTGVDRLIAAGHPVVEIALTDIHDLGAEFFRWEFATAVACACLGVNPFDQPDVESAKVKARESLRLAVASGGVVVEAPTQDSATLLTQLLAGAPPSGYVAIQAYLPSSPVVAVALENLAEAVRRISRLPVTVGFGPRFLHSTGQLHKGDGGQGRFLQLVGGPAQEVPIPGMQVSFDTLKRAQALGDRDALRGAGRTVVTLELGVEVPVALARLAEQVDPLGGEEPTR